MSKLYYPPLGSIEPKVVTVPLKISLSGAGAVSSFVGKGVASVTKSGTGEYTVVLKDNYNKLLSAGLAQLSSALTDVFARVKSADVANKQVVLATDNGTADADTAVAHELHLTLVLTKSSVA